MSQGSRLVQAPVQHEVCGGRGGIRLGVGGREEPGAPGTVSTAPLVLPLGVWPGGTLG